MKTILKLTKATVVVFMAFLSQNVSAQVGIGVGSSQVNASAALEVAATNKGFLPPRMDSTQRNAISTPANGLVIYNTNTNKYNVRESGKWVEMSTKNTNDTFTGVKTFSATTNFNGMVNFNGSMINMTPHMMLPMAEIGFFNETGVTTTTSATAFAAANSSLNWTRVNFPSTAGTGLSNTSAVDSMASMAGRVVNTGGTGVIKYTGTVTKHAHVALTFSYRPTEAAAANYPVLFGVFKNGQLLPESVVSVLMNTTISNGSNGYNSMQSTAIHVMTTLSTGDYLDFRVIGVAFNAGTGILGTGGSGSAAGTSKTVTIHGINFFAMGI